MCAVFTVSTEEKETRAETKKKKLLTCFQDAAEVIPRTSIVVILGNKSKQ